MIKVQITLTSTTGKYKPVSAIIQADTIADFNSNKKEYINKAIKKICYKRGWGQKELLSFGYTRSKCRLYDQEKIEQEKKTNYEQIKEEKYASGEWKRPTTK